MRIFERLKDKRDTIQAQFRMTQSIKQSADRLGIKLGHVQAADMARDVLNDILQGRV